MSIEAMKIAVSDLMDYPFCDDERLVSVIRTLSQAIEQAQKQEPVAWMENSIEFYAKDHPTNSCTIPLYTAPPRLEWVGLTDQECLDTLGVKSADKHFFSLVRAIEAKLRDKNGF